MARSAGPGFVAVRSSRRARHLAAATQSLERGFDRDADQRLAAPPSALPAPSTWPRLDQASDEYRRVTFSANLRHGKDALVSTATASAFRPDVSGRGYWVFTPARLADGALVVVNRGFVPTKLRRLCIAQHDDQISGTVEITGVDALAGHPAMVHAEPTIRRIISGSSATRRRSPPPRIGVPFAPFYVEQESPVPPGGWPQPGKIVVHLRQQPPAIRRDLVRPGARSGCGFRRLGPQIQP